MSRSKSKRGKGNGQPVQQTQSPPTSSSPPFRVTKPTEWWKNKKKVKRWGQQHSNVPNNGGLKPKPQQERLPNHSNVPHNGGLKPKPPQAGPRNDLNVPHNGGLKPKPPQAVSPNHSNGPKNGGLKSKRPQAGPTSRSITKDERAKDEGTKPCVDSSRVKVQDPGECKPTQLQRVRAPKVKVIYETESEFEFAYKDRAESQAQLQSQSSLRSPPSSPPRGLGLKKTTPVCDAHGDKSRESSNLDVDFETGREPASASLSSPSLPQIVVDLKNARSTSNHEYGDTNSEASLSDGESESESEHDPVLLQERGVHLENLTPDSHHDRQHKALKTPLSNPRPEPQPDITSESLERVVGHKEITPASRPGYGQKTREFLTSDAEDDSEPASESGPDSGPEPSSPSLCKFKMRALKRKRSNKQYSSLKAVPLPALSSADSLPRDESEPVLSSEPAWSTMSSPDRPTFSDPTGQDFRCLHWRDACAPKDPPSPSSSYMVEVIGPESPTKSVPGSEFLPPESEPASRYPSPAPPITPTSSPPVPPSAPRVVPRVLSQSPSHQRGPGAKRPRLSLSGNSSESDESTESEESPELLSSQKPGSSNPEQFSEPEETPDPHELSERELSSENVSGVNLGPDLDLIASSDPEPVPDLESPSDLARSSAPGSEQTRTPTSFRDELPTGLVRQLNKKIEDAIARDKKENPRHWGGLWMKEHARGEGIMKRVEEEYRQDLIRKKEEEAERKRIEKVQRDKRKKERERKRMEEQKMREREARKNGEEQKKKKSQKRVESEPKDLMSVLQKILDGETKDASSDHNRPELKGNQSNAQMKRYREAVLLALKLEREREAAEK